MTILPRKTWGFTQLVISTKRHDDLSQQQRGFNCSSGDVPKKNGIWINTNGMEIWTNRNKTNTTWDLPRKKLKLGQQIWSFDQHILWFNQHNHPGKTGHQATKLAILPSNIGSYMTHSKEKLSPKKPGVSEPNVGGVLNQVARENRQG